MPTKDEIEASKTALLAEIDKLPRAEIARFAEHIAEQILVAAEEVRSQKDRPLA